MGRLGITLRGSEQHPLCWDTEIPLAGWGRGRGAFPELGEELGWLIAGEVEEQGVGFYKSLSERWRGGMISMTTIHLGREMMALGEGK